MRRFLFALFASLALCSLATAQEDTTKITEWEDTVIEAVDKPVSPTFQNNQGLDFPDSSAWSMTAGIVAITLAFPIIIVFIAFYFQYRNRKQKYKLVEKALETGQPLPAGFIKNNEDSNIQNKGIKNIFTGIGLFIFLWAITERFSVGSIGLLIMFIGFGQLVIYFANRDKSDHKEK